MDGTTPGANGTGRSVYSLNKKNTAVAGIRQRKIRLGVVWQNLAGGGEGTVGGSRVQGVSLPTKWV